jgi:hypothetical protein
LAICLTLPWILQRLYFGYITDAENISTYSRAFSVYFFSPADKRDSRAVAAFHGCQPIDSTTKCQFGGGRAGLRHIYKAILSGRVVRLPLLGTGTG